jgi:hypothetical protein
MTRGARRTVQERDGRAGCRTLNADERAHAGADGGVVDAPRDLQLASACAAVKRAASPQPYVREVHIDNLHGVRDGGGGALATEHLAAVAGDRRGCTRSM